MEALTTIFICQHPYAKRRAYRASTGCCQVCYDCFAVRTVTDGWWQPVVRLYRKPDLLTEDGRLLIPDYWQARARAPLPSSA